jgi:hypothetical protein
MSVYMINLAPGVGAGNIDLQTFKASTLLQDHEGKSRIYKHGDLVTVTNDSTFGRYFINTYVPLGIAVFVS